MFALGFQLSGCVDFQSAPTDLKADDWWPISNATTIHAVNLDSASHQTVMLRDVLSTSGEKDVYLVRPRAISRTSRDTYFIADSRQNTILEFTAGGSLIRSIGEQGAGPGEFSSLFQIEQGDSAFFVHELGSRIQVLDHSFKYQSSFAVRPTSQQIALSTDLLIGPLAETEEALIGGYSVSPPHELQWKQLPPVYAEGKPFSPFNHTLVAASRNSDSILAAYVSRPVIFELDHEGETTRIWKLEGRMINDFLDQQDDTFSSVTRVRSFFTELVTPCQDEFMFGRGSTLFVVDKESGDVTSVDFVLPSGQRLMLNDVLVTPGDSVHVISTMQAVWASGPFILDACLEEAK